MKAPCHLSLQPVLLKSGLVFGLAELNSITPQNAAGDMKLGGYYTLQYKFDGKC